MVVHTDTAIPMLMSTGMVTITAQTVGDDPGDVGFQSLGVIHGGQDALDIIVDLPPRMFNDVCLTLHQRDISRLKLTCDCIPDLGLAATIRSVGFS